MSEQQDEKLYISMLLYGEGGSGKSIFASTFPNALILDADNGHNAYKKHEKFKNHKYVHGRNVLVALKKAVSQLEKGTNQFDTIVIDSLTNLEQWAKMDIRGLDDINWGDVIYSPDKVKRGNRHSWGSVSGSSIAILLKLKDYPINVVVITQTIDAEDDGIMRKMPELTGQAKAESIHALNGIGYIERVKEGKDIHRLLHISSSRTDPFIAKFRTLGGDQPPIQNPTYDKLMQVLQSDDIKLNFD